MTSSCAMKRAPVLMPAHPSWNLISTLPPITGRLCSVLVSIFITCDARLFVLRQDSWSSASTACPGSVQLHRRPRPLCFTPVPSLSPPTPSYPAQGDISMPRNLTIGRISLIGRRGENTQETADDQNVAGIEDTNRRRGWVHRHFRPVRENIVPPILSTIDALYESADACPPLKSAVGGIRAIVNLCLV